MEDAAATQLEEIETLWRYLIKPKDIAHLDQDCRAALALASFAVTEINVLSRLYLSTSYEKTGDELVDNIVLSQRITILRVWSSKLFELISFLSLAGRNNSTSSEALKASLEDVAEDLSAIKKRAGYKIVRDIRNEVANHYTLNAARKNLQFISQEADLSLYVHTLRGNSFYPMGEEIVFAGRLNRYLSNNPDDTSPSDAFDEWLDWSLKATNLANDVHFKLVKSLILDCEKGGWAEKRICRVLPEMIHHERKPTAPIFFRRKPV